MIQPPVQPPKRPRRENVTVTISAVDPVGPVLTCFLGDGPAVPTSAGGWQFTARPRRVSFTEFLGPDPYTLPIPIMIGDSTDPSGNIEADLETLRGIHRDLVGDRQEPAVVTVTSPAIPLGWLRWVINDIKYNVQYRNNDGARYYAQIDLTLFEYVPTDLVATQVPVSVAQKVIAVAKSKSTMSTKLKVLAPNPNVASVRYTVKKGQTLQTIAMLTLGSAALWTKIAALNGNIRDPKSIKVGQVLYLPEECVLPKK